MRRYLLIIVFLFPLSSLAKEADVPEVHLEHSDAAVKRGEDLFRSTCQTCHSLKYLGLEAVMASEDARTAFGKTPPDLSLMAKARGRGDRGARYIYALLVSYNDTPEKNSVFPNIAMPPVLTKEDKDFDRKARDVATFLFHAAEPSVNERESLGRYVLTYMTVLTILLYFVNLRTWRRLPHK